ncbi:MAG TPA: sensor domain-containing diguanylate cyclase [Solirubrobacterales bacterium]|nr:sensor domain-containing diguanylate cyclase [Solirubrobacterales bacterium]
MPAGALKGQPSLRGRGHSEARAAGVLLVGGSVFVGLSLILPHPAGGDAAALIAIAAAMAVAGIAALLLAPRIPLPATHAIIAATVAATGLLIVAADVAVGQYGSIFVWATLICAYYFPRRVAAAHLAWLLAVYAASLALVENTAGYSPFTRWLFTAISLGVVMMLISVIVSHRARADLRARRFFELSQDMLSTMDTDGRCVEANEAWRRTLGYAPSELEGRPLLELTHPEDHGPALARAREMFVAGAESVDLETRVRAKDGSYRWLRTSSTFAIDEGLVYSRSTDVTERRRLAGEREELLAQVESMARHDALTGLPNRRLLDEQAPREMARARRGGQALCLAIVDIDHFKSYNDSHGHLAGDELLRESAIAWDGELRGSDTLVRYGGEEFLVLLPDTAPEEAAAVVERLRAATPRGQTCSAGIAAWDGVADVDGLISAADAALYRAKGAGRNRLVVA